MKLRDFFGWYGVVAVFLAYTLVGLLILQPDNFYYQILNFTGSLGLMYVSVKKKAYQLGAFYLFWAVIALVALVRMVG